MFSISDMPTIWYKINERQKAFIQRTIAFQRFPFTFSIGRADTFFCFLCTRFSLQFVFGSFAHQQTSSKFKKTEKKITIQTTWFLLLLVLCACLFWSWLHNKQSMQRNETRIKGNGMNVIQYWLCYDKRFTTTRFYRIESIRKAFI